MRYLVTILLCIGIWELMGWFVDRAMLPPFSGVVSHCSADDLRILAKHLGWSLYRLMVGLSLGVMLGAPLGFFMGSSQRGYRLLSPFFYLTMPVPKIVLVPIMILFFGIGDLSKIILLVLVVLYQSMLTIMGACRTVDARYKQTIAILGGNPWDLWRHVMLPAALPGVVTAIRLSLATVIALLFFTETYATDTGIGFYVWDSFAQFQYVRVYWGVITLSMMGLCMYYALEKLEARLSRWKEASW